MRKYFVAAALAIVVAVAAGAAFGSSGSSNRTAISCAGSVRIGLMAPITGPAAPIGGFQVNWAVYFAQQYNKTHKHRKLVLVQEDTMLGSPTGTAESVKGAKALASDSSVLGVVGPAGSNEVKATSSSLKGGGFAFVSGSATNTTLTSGGRVGYFFRTVPPDSEQSKSVSKFIIKRLHSKRVYIIDDQEAYSTGLAGEVQKQLKKAHVHVSRDGVSQKQADFSSLIAKIPRNTQLVYLPWQIAAQAKGFGQQMKQAGKGGIALMGSDGLFDTQFSGLGNNIYDSFFPIDSKNKVIKAFAKKHHGDGEFFGAPTYVATQVVAGAVDKACFDGSATRSEVRKNVAKTNFPKTLLGLPVRFDHSGDMKKKPFGIYKSKNGKFVRIA